MFAVDALTAVVVVGGSVPDVELCTGVVPTYPRHPLALAGQALTTQAATGGRLTLGIGPSHQFVIENVYRLSYERPLRHMRGYLAILRPLLQEGHAQVIGETLSTTTSLPVQVPGASPPPVLLGALGPGMLALAGREADGTLTWMTGPRTLASHVLPIITRAAAEAGRPPPRVAVGLPVCVTDDPAAARAACAGAMGLSGVLHAYQAMLDREGVDGPGDIAIVGDEDEVTAALASLADLGATDVVAATFGSEDEVARTLATLGRAST